MLDALGAVEAAAQTHEFKKQLSAYRDARKVRVCADQVRTIILMFFYLFIAMERHQRNLRELIDGPGV